jgi:hypothetical protein
MVPCRPHAKADAVGLNLDESHQLPNFAALDGAPSLVDIRAAWNERALHFQLSVRGKRQAPWCRENRLEESDGLRIWIDTRDTHNIHRASRFCHQFVFLPTGSGPRLDMPVADQMLINRARENAQPVRQKSLKIETKKTTDGYNLSIAIPAEALTGFDPVEYPRLGFFWCVVDREIGSQQLALTPEFPFMEDPSVWATLELVRG